MAKKKSTSYYSRKFLNRKHGTAFLEITGDNPKSGFYLKLADCAKQVTLDFSVRDWEEDSDTTKNGIGDKLNLLISELEKARDWMFPEDVSETKE